MTEQQVCEDRVDGVTCPHPPEYWMTKKQWPLTNSTQVNCTDSMDPKASLTWGTVVAHPSDSTWYLLARQTIAASLSVASGAHVPADLGAALNTSQNLLTSCNEFTPENDSQATSLANYLQSYTNGDMDPTTLLYQGSTVLTSNSLQSGGGGQGGVSGETGGLVVAAVLVPVVVVALVAISVWAGIRAWKGRHQKVVKGDEDNVDMQELRNRIDENKGEEEEGEPLDVGALEDLQL